MRSGVWWSRFDIVFRNLVKRSCRYTSTYHVLYIEWSGTVKPQLFQIMVDDATEKLVAWHNKIQGLENRNPRVFPHLFSSKLKESEEESA